MNRRVYRWIYRKAADILGPEEIDSLKNDLLNPVREAVRDAAADLVGDLEKQDTDETGGE